MQNRVASTLVLGIGLLTAIGISNWNQLISNAFGDNERDLKKYKDVEHLYRAIDNNKFDDNNINWKDFKSTPIFENATHSMQKCITKAEHLGDNLADYEIYDCYERFDKD
jgi:hypothetical protein